MFVSNNARIIVSENLVLPQIAPFMNDLRQTRPEVFVHCLNVAYLVAEISLRNYNEDLFLPIERDSIHEVVQGALLHDIGKMEIDNAVLLKHEALTENEVEEIKLHPVYGYDMVKDNPDLSDLTKDIILSHHERADGLGYPNGVKDIKNEVKLVSICDKYDALTEHRSYRRKKDTYTAFKIIAQEQNLEDLDVLLLLASVEDK